MPRPAWKIEVDGRDITDRLRSRLIRLSVTDSRGERSDRCSLELADDPPVDWPDGGRRLRVSMGWDGQVTELGSYAITRPVASDPPPVLRVEGHAVGHGGSGAGAGTPLALVGASRQWEAGTTLGDMARAMARDLGVEAVVSGDAASRPLERIVQDGETHVAVLLRTSRSVGATFQILGSGDHLRLVVADDVTRSTAGSGRALPRIVVPRSAIDRWEGEIVQRNEIGRVVARWQSTSDGSSGDAAEEEGDGPEVTLPGSYGSAEAAQEAARGALRRRRAKARTLSATLHGDPRILYGVELDVTGALRRGLDGVYRVTEATHDLTAKGYITRVKAEAVR